MLWKKQRKTQPFQLKRKLREIRESEKKKDDEEASVNKTITKNEAATVTKTKAEEKTKSAGKRPITPLPSATLPFVMRGEWGLFFNLQKKS